TPLGAWHAVGVHWGLLNGIEAVEPRAPPGILWSGLSHPLPVCGSQCPEQPSLSSPAGPWQPSPHWLHVSLEMRHQQCKRRRQNVSSLPRPPALTAMRDLFTSQKQACWQEHIRKETAAQVAWNISYGHKHLKEGPLPRKRLQKAPFSGAIPGHQLPVGRPETRGLQDQLSRGVGVQGPPPKGDRVRQARRATRGLAGQTKPGGLGMKQLLFQGISLDGQGQASYLRDRHWQKPEEKFPSWEYSWHVGESMKDTRAPAYARFQPITKSFYIKSSILHVPRRTDQRM
ncbi:hypothetical protein EI555_019222, partial [Monodon monoceros]